jgi:PAS domain S-box-containing protein
VSDLSEIRSWIYSKSTAGVVDQRYLAQMRDVEQFFTYVFDNNPDGISILDRELTIMGVNRAMERWYVDKAPLRGKKCYEAYHARRRPCTNCPTCRALETGESQVGIVPYETSHGAEGTQELLTFPLFDDRGSVIGVIEYVRDISRLEEEERVIDNLKRRLQLRDKELHEQDAALRVLLRQRGLEEARPERNAASTVLHQIRPLLEQLKALTHDAKAQEIIGQMENGLDRASMPLTRRLASAEYGLSQRELEVASFIVNGKSSKEISGLLGISTKAVSFHRANIRRKLGLTARRENLRARLIELGEN